MRSGVARDMATSTVNRTAFTARRATGIMVAVPAVIASRTPATATTLPRSSADGHVIRVWNELALDTVRQKNASDAEAARLYAMVNVAMYDAVNGLSPRPERRTAALVPAGDDVSGDPEAAAAGAAHEVLASLYPDLTPRYDDELAADLAAVSAPGRATRGRARGSQVGAEVVAARQEDGSSPPDTLGEGMGAGSSASPGRVRSSARFYRSPSPIRTRT